MTDYGLAPRIGSKRHGRRPTLGVAVGEVAHAMGLELHPWQRFRADVQGELVPRVKGKGRRLAARVALTLAGRQTGKTTAVTADVATRCLAPDLDAVAKLVGHPVGPQHVAFTAQDRIGALGRWYDHVDMIMSSELAGFVAKVVRKNGEECMHWRNGSKYRVVTPSKTGARGLALDLVVIDEALAHEPWLLGAVSPTMAQRDGARTSFGAQLLIVSNAGDEHAELLNQQRELGRRAVLEGDVDRVHLEWSCADDDDVLDPRVWSATIPTLDQPDGIETAFLELEAETMGTDQFAREYLCRTVLSEARRLISPAAWDDLPRVELTPGAGGVLGVDCTPDRTYGAVVAARRMGDLIGLEVIRHEKGTDWLEDFVIGLAGKVGARVVVDQFGPAAMLVPLFRQAGLKVLDVKSREVADAAGWLVDAVSARAIGHDGDDRLLKAVSELARRKRGDRWSFDRHSGDISTLTAASLAAWTVETQPVRTPVIH